METFWKTISAYNASTWLVQLLFVLTGLFLTIKLYRKPTERTKTALKIFMILLNLWITVFYYLIYCSTRDYYYIFAFFWGIITCIWIYELIWGNYNFERSYKYDKISYILYAMIFLYPLISLCRGLHFPEVTSPIMPCTVTIFTIGILISFSKKINLFLILFLFHWAMLGISKIYLYKIPEDILLTICVVPMLFIYLKEYIYLNISVDSKPGIQSINMLLLGTCSIIGVVFSYIIIKSFGYI